MPDVNELRMLLAECGMSQAEFARRIGSSVQCVNAWCSGRVGRSAERPALAYRLALMLLRSWVPKDAGLPGYDAP